MHQQLSLHSIIPDSGLKITLHTLAALSGMSPERIFTHCLAWTPKRPFQPVLAAGQVNKIEQYRLTLTCDLIQKDENEPTKHAKVLQEIGFNEATDELRKRKWTMNSSEIPEAGKRKVTSQPRLSATIEEGDPFQLMEKLGYMFSNEYWLKGYRIVMGDIVIAIFRICLKSKNEPSMGSEEFVKMEQEEEEEEKNGEVMEIDKEEVIDLEMMDTKPVIKEEQKEEKEGRKEGRDFKLLELLDSSGQWMIKAHIDVKQSVDVEAITSATGQLEKLQQDMVGLFDLVLPDRNSFDTTIRARR
jgi:hypothetical protein